MDQSLWIERLDIAANEKVTCKLYRKNKEKEEKVL